MIQGATVRHELPESRRDAILRAAEDAFAEFGYDRARLEDVAQRVGIRRASLLYHYRGKATLYAAVLDRLFADLGERYRRVGAGGGSAGERVEHAIDAWLDFVAARPALLPIMLRELAAGGGERSWPFADRALVVFAPLLDVITEGQARHELRRTDALEVLMVLGGAGTFLALGGRLLPSCMAPESTAIADRARQRELLVAVVRKLLGTRGPRRVLED